MGGLRGYRFFWRSADFVTQQLLPMGEEEELSEGCQGRVVLGSVFVDSLPRDNDE